MLIRDRLTDRQRAALASVVRIAREVAVPQGTMYAGWDAIADVETMLAPERVAGSPPRDLLHDRQDCGEA